MSTLVMLSPAPVIELPGGEVVLDPRFVEGMRLHCQLWPGRVICVMRRGADSVPEGTRYTHARLGFDLILTEPDSPMNDTLLETATLVYCAADDMEYLPLAAKMRGRIGKLVYTVEQSLGERVETALRAARPLRGRLGGAVWNLRHEGRLRAALRQADGVHLNGPAAAASYGGRNPRTLPYLDNRLRQTQLARATDQAARAGRLTAGAPLRLVAPGPLAEGSGVEDLLPMAARLRAGGTGFTLEILGQGPLAARLAARIAELDLGDRVTLRDPGTFDSALLPHLRQTADLALLAHRLPTAPAAYIQAMGCGLPVLGYATATWRRLAARSGAGWAVPARAGALAREVARLDTRRDALIAASGHALAFAAENTFEKVFARRMAHLRALAKLEDG